MSWITHNSGKKFVVYKCHRGKVYYNFVKYSPLTRCNSFSSFLFEPSLCYRILLESNKSNRCIIVNIASYNSEVECHEVLLVTKFVSLIKDWSEIKYLIFLINTIYINMVFPGDLTKFYLYLKFDWLTLSWAVKSKVSPNWSFSLAWLCYDKWIKNNKNSIFR